jgi:DUF4097 and DUF4098 domain-containing protein YvlB
MEKSFEISADTSLDVRIASGKVSVVRGAAGRVSVKATGDTDHLVVEQRGSSIWISTEKRSGWVSRSVYVTVEAPDDIDMDVNIASADFECAVTPRRLTINSASGDIRLKDSGELSVKTASGDVNGHSVSGRLTFASASGDLHVETIGDRSELSTASGDLRISHAGGSMVASTLSGDVRVDHFAGREFQAKSMSGNVDIGIPSGTEVDLDATTLSGDIRLPGKADHEVPIERSVDLRVRLVSGDLRLRRA